MPKADSPAQTGLESSPLSESEAEQLNLYTDRGLIDVRGLDTKTVRDLFQSYQEEIQQAAEVAKAEFDKGFDGESPTSGRFGVSRIRAGYFGYDTWDNCPDATSGSTTTWIDNAVPDNLGGSGGQSNPATVGDSVVHIITAIGSHEQSPKAEAVKFRLNDQPRTAAEFGYQFRETDLRYKPLTTPIIMTPDDDIFAEFYGAAGGTESLYLDGLTFIESKDYREIDPANMAGTSIEGNIIVQ